MSQVEHTHCPMDCPDACALEVEVRDGNVERIGGRTDHPDTAGFICSKIANFDRRLDHVDRLLQPMRRVGAKGDADFEPLSWNDAIGEITERFRAIKQEWGGEAILPFHYGGSNGVFTDGLLDALYFDRLGATQLEYNICAAPTTAVAMGMYGKMPGVAFSDYPKAKCIIIWGANPKASNIHLVPYLKQAKEQGAFVALVDPRQTLSRQEVDLHLPVRPGTDLPVALAMIGLWVRDGVLDHSFLDSNAKGAERLLSAAAEWTPLRAAEICGVEAAQIEKLAEVYRSSQPAVIRCGWGLERNINGGQAVAAVLAMPTLLGKFGVAGGGYTMSNGRMGNFDSSRVIGQLDSTRRSIDMTRLGHWLNGELDPPIKAMFVYNANPAATVPDQNGVFKGLRRDDLFTVVFDQVMTDTARFADIVLPATTFLEHDDLRMGYGSYVLAGVRPVVPRRGEARTNNEVFRALAAEMGFDDAAFQGDDSSLLEKAIAALELEGCAIDGVADGRVLADGGNLRPDFPGETPIQFDSIQPKTPDGKVNLSPGELGAEPFRFEVLESDYPLALISPASSKMISSTLGEYNYPRLVVEIHPSDATGRDISDGDRVRVFNDLGEVHCYARVSQRERSGVVAMAKGAWAYSSLNGRTSNALCPAHLSEVANGACFNDARVEVELLAPA